MTQEKIEQVKSCDNCKNYYCEFDSTLGTSMPFYAACDLSPKRQTDCINNKLKHWEKLDD